MGRIHSMKLVENRILVLEIIITKEGTNNKKRAHQAFFNDDPVEEPAPCFSLYRRFAPHATERASKKK